MVTVKQGKAVRQPLRERAGYKQSREEPADESRLNKSGSFY